MCEVCRRLVKFLGVVDGQQEREGRRQDTLRDGKDPVNQGCGRVVRGVVGARQAIRYSKSTTREYRRRLGQDGDPRGSQGWARRQQGGSGQGGRWRTRLAEGEGCEDISYDCWLQVVGSNAEETNGGRDSRGSKLKWRRGVAREEPEGRGEQVFWCFRGLVLETGKNVMARRNGRGVQWDVQRERTMSRAVVEMTGGEGSAVDVVEGRGGPAALLPSLAHQCFFHHRQPARAPREGEPHVPAKTCLGQSLWEDLDGTSHFYEP